MGNVFKGKYGGLFQMMVGTLGLVVFTTLFANVLTYFVALVNNSALANFLLMDILVKVGPTILFIAGIGSAIYFGEIKGYQKASSAGISSIILIIFGFVEIIFFLALFETVLNNFETLRTTDNVDYFIALSLAISIGPAMAFLAGLFSGAGAMVGGFRQSKKEKKAAAGAAT